VSVAVIVATFLAVTPAVAQEQSAPLLVTATVVSTCQVDVPGSAAVEAFATVPVSVTCARGTTPRVQRPLAPARHVDIHDALLVIDF
jgi:xanthine/uracil/vitamin C permease (AzgA family)